MVELFMKKYELWGFHVEIDENATKEWYIEAEPWGCECGDCRNFLLLAQKRMLPVPVMDTLDMLGIPLEKATYVCAMMPDGEGHLYQFSYRIAGNIVNEKALDAVPQSWGEVRCCHELYPYGAPNFPGPHFDLEFWVTLPWALETED